MNRGKMAKEFWIFALAGMFFFLTGIAGFAEDISIEVELSSRRIALGSNAQLMITVNGSQEAAIDQMPEIEGFEVNFLGPSTRVSIVNGQYSSSKTFVYSLFPLKEGKFEVPAIPVVISGKTYMTDPVEVEVTASADPSAAAPTGQQPASISDKVFLVLETPKTEVYLNERLDIKIRLFVTGLSVRDIQYPEFETIGFTIGSYDQPRQYQQIVNGVPYDVVEFNNRIYPTRTGDLRLGPATTRGNILVRGAGRPRGFGGPAGMFDDDFFNSFFDQYEKQPISLKSEAVSINVLDFPSEGKPRDFSGAVGHFDFNVSVSPTEVKEGDPITLRMTVTGENLAALQMPSFPAGGLFKLYDPQITQKDNTKQIEQVIIPQSDSVAEIPAMSFSYFDSPSKQYRTITRGPFPIQVTKPDKSEEFKVVGGQGEIRMAEPETLGQDIVFIKKSPGRLTLAGKTMTGNAVFYLIILAAAVLWLVGLIYYKHSARIRTDSVYARRLQAPRQAREGLAQARKLIAARRKELFYDTVFKTIQQYLGNKFHLPSGAVAFETVREHLQQCHVDPKVVEDVKLTYDECDMIRYASADVSPEKMNVTYQRLAHIIDHLERFVK